MNCLTRWLLLLGLLGTLAAPLLGCGKDTNGGATVENSDPIFFKDITEKVGLNFVHNAGVQDQRFFLPQICGSGLAVFDFNKDDLMDLYFVHSAGPGSKAKNRLYQQMKDKTFQDVSEGSGLDIDGFNMGATAGDFNNDGLPDLLVTSFNTGVKLFQNLGNGKFKDVTEEAGLYNPYWSTSAAFFDYDRDGWLDLFIVNYVNLDRARTCEEGGGKRDYCSPKNFKGTPSKLFRNLGKKAASEGKAALFEDVSLATGVGRLAGPGLGIIVGDFSADGWPDVLVANDGEANYLWINKPKDPKAPDKERIFSEEAMIRNVAFNNIGQKCANMGCAWGDINNDHMFDLFITHLPDENNTLWRQIAPGQFQDTTALHGLANPVWRGAGWGVTFQDFDNDGWLDLAIVNGRVSSRGNFRGDNWKEFVEHYGDRNQVFVNDGAGKFKDISVGNKDFTERSGVFRALIWGDLDNDGAMDLVATEIHGQARVFRNVAPKRGNWLMIRALEPKLGDRDAYGALLTIHAGNKKWVREVNPSQSYLTVADPRVHVGLGKAEKVDRIEVLWGDGAREVFPAVDVNKHITLRKGEGKASPAK